MKIINIIIVVLLISLNTLSAQDDIVTKSPIAVLEFDNYLNNFNVSEMGWDEFSHPKFVELRDKFKLAEIIKPGKTEFDKMLLMLDWVSKRWRHHSSNIGEDQNALAILNAAEKGERFRCVEFSIVFANCMTALGYPARTIALQREGVSLSSSNHVCAEIWSNQFQKWVVVDPQNNGYWKSGETILNADECRNLYAAGREDEMEFIIQDKTADVDRLKKQWIFYFFHIKFPERYTFFEKLEHSTSSDNRIEFMSKNVLPELYYAKRPKNPRWTTDKEKAYPQLNQTTILLEHTDMEKPSPQIRISLKHIMTYFAKFMVKINESGWEEKEDSFIWSLEKGLNSIEVKAVNRSGIEGRPSKIVLRNNISN